MSIYLAQITIEVNLVMSNANGYDLSMRAAMITFLDTTIVNIVNPAMPANEVDVAIFEGIQTNVNYKNAVGPFKLTLYDLCEFTVNLVIGSSTIGGGAQILKILISQTGVAAPTIAKVLVNTTLLALPILTRNAAGIYLCTFASPILTSGKYSASLLNPEQTFGNSRTTVVNNDASSVGLITEKMVASIVTGVISAAASDGLLNGSYSVLEITVYP